MVLSGLKTIFTVIAGVIVAVVVVIGTLIAVIGAVAGAIAGAFGAIVGFVVGVVGGISDAVVAGLSALDPSAFVAKMKELALSGLAAFKGIFGIHSPSTVMLEHGEENIAGAAATGVDKGGAKVDKAMAKMGPKLGGGGAKDGGAGAGFVAHFTNCVFGGALTQADVDEMMASWWERQAAGGPEAEPT
jgi:phage-related protein